MVLGFWVSSFQVSANLKTNGNQWKLGNYLLMELTSHNIYIAPIHHPEDKIRDRFQLYMHQEGIEPQVESL